MLSKHKELLSDDFAGVDDGQKNPWIVRSTKSHAPYEVRFEVEPTALELKAPTFLPDAYFRAMMKVKPIPDTGMGRNPRCISSQSLMKSAAI